MYKVTGHCVISDDNNNIILDETNDIHPGNFARAIARSLANESSYWINSMAFGWGATVKNYDGTYRKYTPNDGIAPDYSGWQSSLYNETYRAYIDPISLGSKTTIEDAITPPTTSNSDVPVYTETHRNVNGIVSYVDSNANTIVEINCILGVDAPSETKVYTFDEIALYTGPVYSPISSYQDVMVNTKTNTTFVAGNNIPVVISVDDSVFSFSFTATGSTYTILIDDLNRKLRKYYCYAEVLTDRIRFHNNYSVFRLVSSTLFTNLTINDTVIVENSKTLSNIVDEGVHKNNPFDPITEKPRLLTHLIFNPIDKPKLSNYHINYKLKIEVAPTPKKDNNLDFVLPNDYRLLNTYEYNAVQPIKEWVIYHQLGYTPRIEVFSDNVILVEYDDYVVSYGDAGTPNAADNQVTIRFKVPKTGTARFY